MNECSSLSAAADEMASATAGDYDLIDLELVFEDGESEQSMNIQINDDAIPELMEYFTVLLENPPAGSALIDPDAVSPHSIDQ